MSVLLVALRAHLVAMEWSQFSGYVLRNQQQVQHISLTLSVQVPDSQTPHIPFQTKTLPCLSTWLSAAAAALFLLLLLLLPPRRPAIPCPLASPPVRAEQG